MDWTVPVSIAVSFLGLAGVLLLWAKIGLPGLRLADKLEQGQIELKERVHNVALDLATFKQKDFQKLRHDADEHAKQISSLQNSAAAKALGR